MTKEELIERYKTIDIEKHGDVLIVRLYRSENRDDKTYFVRLVFVDNKLFYSGDMGTYVFGKDYVVDLWLKKKKENKPSRSKRRYQAYLYWCDWNDSSFKDFLDWLKITEKDELYYPEECEFIREYKKRWQI